MRLFCGDAKGLQKTPEKTDSFASPQFLCYY